MSETLYVKRDDRNWSDAGAFHDVTDKYAPVVEVERLRKQVERWQAVAYVDGADVTARARAEGIVVETGRERAFRAFLREFYARP